MQACGLVDDHIEGCCLLWAPRAVRRQSAAEPTRLGAPAARPYVFFNFVTTFDGRAALDGSTRPLGGPADVEMLLSLRAVADAVLIGPGTVRAEGYGRLVGPDRAGPSRRPPC